MRSELGVGSTFSLRLPLAVLGGTRAATPSQGATVQAAARPAVQSSAATVADVRRFPPRGRMPAAGHRILVVDDDPRNAFVLADVLEMHGMTVVQATDGREGDRRAGAGDIDLVLMDVMMPRMDGYETTRAIRKMPQYASLPVITVTARAMQGDREKSIDAGASDYITKPIDIEELLNCMERWLG